MRISRIQVHNFRNFRQLDVRLDTHAVIVGENKVGKSNLLYALRLILDPSLPDTACQLRNEDFWDGLKRPLTENDRILISIDVTDFEDNENQKSVLCDHLVEAEPMTARLTYVYQPKPTLEGNPTKEADYEFMIYGGDRPEYWIGYEVRGRIPLDVLAALRDAEGDLANWRRRHSDHCSMRRVPKIDRTTLESILQHISQATDSVTKTPEIDALAKQITTKLAEMVGSAQAVDTLLGFSPTDHERLIRSLRLFIDGGKRGISDASLGSANLIYLALKSLELEQLVRQGSRDHTFLGIEEPEAHLHPHLHRLIYRDFLGPRSYLGDSRPAAQTEQTTQNTILLTTHSPHIVSVAPLRSLVVLHKLPGQNSSEGVSTANLDLDEKDVADLERYLDVTRGELLFARGVLLVEGDAELFLVPILGKLNNFDFDELGITVCSVSGTNFLPYTKFLGPTGVDIPFAVLTDLDPQEGGSNLGETRVLRLLAECMDQNDLKGKGRDELLKLAPQKGFFLNTHTLEVDLFRCGRHRSMCDSLIELSTNEAARARAKAWRETPGQLDVEWLLKDISAISKGRFAQRLATRLRGSACPRYIREAIRYVAERCG